MTNSGANYISTQACSAHVIIEGFLGFIKDETVNECSQKLGKNWINECDNFNYLLEHENTHKKEIMGELL